MDSIVRDFATHLYDIVRSYITIGFIEFRFDERLRINIQLGGRGGFRLF
jgi:hypothetical protein